MAIESNDTNLSDLLYLVETGKAQLPDFQRSWVWDDYKICKLIESITSGYPMGAGMFLQTGNDSVRFTYRLFEGVDNSVIADPEYLVLDGQQRLTTLFQVFKSSNPVRTSLPTDKNKRIKRYYYIDIEKALDPDADRLDAIVSVPESKIITEDFGRKEVLDLTTREKEFQKMMFPLNIVFSTVEKGNWMMGLMQQEGLEKFKLFQRFQENIIEPIQQYKIPIIKLSKETPKEAVCQIFENVNTGGVPLTVFELVTATFATDGFKLREDWEKITKDLTEHNEILSVVDSPAFLTAITLLISYQKSRNPVEDASKKVAVACKRKDVLNLKLNDYISSHDALIEGFKKASDFLVHQGIYSPRDLPYTTQLIPLAAIYAYAATCKNPINLKLQCHEQILTQWYWCGVFGELYGAANETRYVNDIIDVIAKLEGKDEIPETISRASFYATRLLSMHTRNSAAYKGVMALINKNHPRDFMSGNSMDIAAYLKESTDIHHIFPQAYCKKMGYSWDIYDSVINKTPIYAVTNRTIGGRAPSEYIQTMRNAKKMAEDQIVDTLSSHLINYDLLKSDDFNGFIADRATRLLDCIENAMGKAVAGREAEDTIQQFGRPLLHISAEIEPAIAESDNESTDDEIVEKSQPLADSYYDEKGILHVVRKDISIEQANAEWEAAQNKKFWKLRINMPGGRSISHPEFGIAFKTMILELDWERILRMNFEVNGVPLISQNIAVR